MELYQERILKVLFVLIWGLALIHMTAEYYYLYWTLRWFDIVTHFLGGVWVGIAGIWFWYFSGYVGTIRMPKRAFLLALASGILIGFVWEGYEFAVWQLSGQGLPPNYIPDSALDLVMDCVGACVGFLLVQGFLLKKSSQRV